MLAGLPVRVAAFDRSALAPEREMEPRARRQRAAVQAVSRVVQKQARAAAIRGVKAEVSVGVTSCLEPSKLANLEAAVG